MTDFVDRMVEFSDSKKVKVNMNNPVARYNNNPIITASDVNKHWINPAHQVKTIHNAGINIYNGETVMLYRSHLRCGMSVLGMDFA